MANIMLGNMDVRFGSFEEAYVARGYYAAYIRSTSITREELSKQTNSFIKRYGSVMEFHAALDNPWFQRMDVYTLVGKSYSRSFATYFDGQVYQDVLHFYEDQRGCLIY